MASSYQIIRINEDKNSVDILIDINGRTLQQEVAGLADFGVDTVHDAAIPHIAKFSEDLAIADAARMDVPPALEALIGQVVEV